MIRRRLVHLAVLALLLLVPALAHAGISVVQSPVGAQGNAVTSITTTGITTTSGNGIIITAVNGGAAGTGADIFSGVSDSNANTWTQAGATQGNTTESSYVRQFYNCNITGGANHTFTITITAARFPSIAVTEITGQAQNNCLNVVNGNTEAAAGTSHTSPSVTTTAGGAILFGSYTDNFNAGTTSVAGGYTAGSVLDGSATAQTIGHEYKITTTTVTDTSNFTTVSSIQGANIVGAYVPAACGGGLMMMGIGC